MRRLLSILMVACALSLPAQFAEAADTSLLIGDAMLDEYPRVKLRLGMPAASDTDPQFVVSENGRRVEVLDLSKLDADPVDTILVIDTSGSMRGEAMDAAKSAASAFVDGMVSGSKVGVISFSDKPRLVTPLAPSMTSVLHTAVGGLEAKGETALYDALIAAAGEASRAGIEHPVIVVLSDGGDTVSRATLDHAVKSVKAVGAPVLVVALPSAESDFSVLQAIAQQTGGRFSALANADELVGYYSGLAEQLQTGWSMTYVSSRPSTKDLDVSISAQLGKEQALGSIVLPNPLFVGAPADAGSALQPIRPASVLTLVATAALVFFAVFAFIVALLLLLIPQRTALDQLKYYEQLQRSSEFGDAEGEYSDRMTASLMGAVDYVAGKRGIKRFAYEKLDSAGLPLRPIEYITIHLIAVSGIGVVSQLVGRSFALSVLAVVTATLAPLVYLDMRASKRQRAFEAMLPDVLGLISSSLRSGWGLQQSVDMIVEQMNAPVSVEFARAQTEIRLGRPVEEALENVSKRMQCPDFAWAVAAIGIQRDVGGNLAEVLDVVAATIRDRTALKRQIRALTAEGKLSAWVLILLPFVLVVLIGMSNAEYLARLYTTVPGLVMLTVGGVLLVVGAIWLRRIVVIEV